MALHYLNRSRQVAALSKYRHLKLVRWHHAPSPLCTLCTNRKMLTIVNGPLHNDLMLNSDKTEAIVISAVNTRAHATVDVVIDVCGCVVTPAPYVRDIGVWFDSTMSMVKNVSRVCQMAYCQLRSIARIRRSITTAACRTIVHALVMSRLDYCNALLYGLPDAQLQKLQFVQNSAARLVTVTRRREHITPVMFALHWLPIRQRIQFKLLLLVYRCTHQLAPDYLTALVVPYVPAR